MAKIISAGSSSHNGSITVVDAISTPYELRRYQIYLAAAIS